MTSTRITSPEGLAEALCLAHLGIEGAPRGLGGGKHAVTRVTAPTADVVVKIHARDNGHVPNVGGEMATLLAGSGFVPDLLAASGADDDVSFTISRFVTGESLLTRYRAGNLDDAALDRLATFLRDYVVHCEGLDPAPVLARAGAASWDATLEGLVDSMAGPLDDAPAGPGLELARAYEQFLREYIRCHLDRLAAVELAVVPVDLNFTNFVVTPDERFVAVDLDAFLVGDPRFALGELLAHIHGSDLAARVLHLEPFRGWVSSDDVTFYAILATFMMLAYAVERDIPADTMKPWENTQPVTHLLAAHREALECRRHPSHRPVDQAEPLLKLSFEVARVRPLGDVLVNADERKGLAGITRVPDIAGLDVLDIPAYQCVRPLAERGDGTFSIFSGKGETDLECQVSAIMEGIERYCAERGSYPREKVLTGSFHELGRDHDLLSPTLFTLPKEAHFDPDLTYEWIPAFDVLSGRTHHVAANFVFYPYEPPDVAVLARHFTTGLGAGSTFDEVLHHGLAEVIERDAALLNMVLRNNPAVDPASVTDRGIREKVRGIKGAGLDVIIRLISAPDIPIPVFSVVIDDPMAADPMFVCGGFAAHPHKDAALRTALNEAVLSRAGTISGAREDLTKIEDEKSGQTYEQFKERYRYWFDQSRTVDYEAIPDFRSLSIDDDIRHMLRALTTAGFTRVLTVDLTDPRIGLPVVKVLVPGIERYSWRPAFGERVRRFWQQQQRTQRKEHTP